MVLEGLINCSTLKIKLGDLALGMITLILLVSLKEQGSSLSLINPIVGRHLRVLVNLTYDGNSIIK